MKNSKIELKEKDIITLSNGVKLNVEYSDTDGSGCHCCDNGTYGCYFLNHESNFCNKNYCNQNDGFMDYGPNLVFIPVDNMLCQGIYNKTKSKEKLPDDIDIVLINNTFIDNRYKLKYKY